VKSELGLLYSVIPQKNNGPDPSSMFPELKPYLTALILPPMSLIALILLGSWFMSSKKHRNKSRSLVVLSALVLALASTSQVAVWLNDHLLPQSPFLDANAIRHFQPGAIVILGGGVEAPSADGLSQLNPTTLDRLRYGVELHRKTALPMLFSGGSGWGAKEDQSTQSEAQVTKRVAKEVFAVEVKWLEGQSRDTEENAIQSFRILNQEGIRKILLVTNAWHMARSLEQFKAAGFDVMPAPMGPISINSEASLGWIPSAEGLKNTSTVLREALAIQVIHFKNLLK